jgi:hypothetical protein
VVHSEQTPVDVFTRIPQDGFLDETDTQIYDGIARATEGLYSAIERDASGAEALSSEKEMAAFLGALPLERATYDVVHDGRIHAAYHTKLLLPFMSGYPLVMNPLYLPEVEVRTAIDIHAVVPDARFDYVDGLIDQPQQPENMELGRELWAASYILDDVHVKEIRRAHHAATKDYALHEQRATILGVAGTPVQRRRTLGMFKRSDVYDYTTPEKAAELKTALAEQLRGAEDIAVTAHVHAAAFTWGLHGYDALALKTASDRTDTPVTPPERVPMSLRVLGAMVARSQS